MALNKFKNNLQALDHTTIKQVRNTTETMFA